MSEVVTTTQSHVQPSPRQQQQNLLVNGHWSTPYHLLPKTYHLIMYKHWKKIALALTALFWASCDETSSVEGPDLYGCPPDICNPMPESSSSVNPLPSSSSNEQIACKRQSRIYDTRENDRNYISVDYYECKDGTICEDYGYIDSFSCTDYQGKYISHTKDEFNSKYNVENELID